MSIAFENFNVQYNSTGRQKADGYDESHFDGMTESEKKHAFNMLLRELGASQNSTEWLFKLDPKRAEEESLKYLEKTKDSTVSGEFVIYYYLYKYSNNKNFQLKLIERFPEYPDYQKKHSLRYIGSTSPCLEISDFFKEILSGKYDDESLLWPAAEQYLRVHRVPNETNDEQVVFREYLNQLIEQGSSIKDKVIQDVENKFPLV